MADHVTVLALYEQHGGNIYSMVQMGSVIKARARVGLAQVLNNGLNDAESRDLMHCNDPQLIAKLVLTGLGRL